MASTSTDSRNSQPGSANSVDPRGNSERSILDQVQARKKQRRRKSPPEWFQTLAQRWKNSESIKPELRELAVSYRHELISYAASAFVLCLLTLLMAAWILPAEQRDYLFDLLAMEAAPEIVPLDTVVLDQQTPPQQIQTPSTAAAMQQLEALEQMEAVAQSRLDTFQEPQISLQPTLSDLKALASIGDLGGRTAEGRQIALKEYGGTAASEQAVVEGLGWLSGIQQKDGGWSFQNQGPDAERGALKRSRNAATSMALLCFLGAGHTHVNEGPYQATVQKALQFLIQNSSVQQGAADLRGDYEGNAGMYTHGLATICLTEASALAPKDKELNEIARQACRFIERSQTSSHGGWRYKPDSETGDTSVVGWMVMALYSGRTAGVRISGRTLRLARGFLRDAATDSSQAFYGYRPGMNRKESTTAIGLLCRMYLGWGPETEAIEKGAGYLSSIGPSKDNMYYNYYATQVMHHFGGDLWEKWNNVMREQLVKRQIRKGPAKGSWKPQGPHHESGGQLYETALCVLTLEVYYRHLPLFQKLEAAEDGGIDAGNLGDAL